MSVKSRNSVSSVVAVAVRAFAALTFLLVSVLPTAAQNPIIQNQLSYYTSAATINSDLGGKDVVIGKTPGGAFGDAAGDTDLGTTDDTKYAISVVTGALLNGSGEGGYGPVNIFNRNALFISGGSIDAVVPFILQSFDDSNIYISGGTVSRYILTSDNSKAYVSGGTIEGILVHDGSYLEFGDGAIGRYGGGGAIQIEENGALQMNGGTAENGITVLDRGTANIMGGIIKHGFGVGGNSANYVGDTSVIANFGGVATADFAAAGHSSILNVTGGEIGILSASFDSVVNLTGGFVQSLICFNDSVVNISGGIISANTIYQQNDTATTNFFGRALSFSNAIAGTDPFYGAAGVFYDTAWIRPDGVLVNTRYFDFGGDVSNPIPQGVTFTFQGSAAAPEPGSLALFALALPLVGVVAARRRGLK